MDSLASHICIKVQFKIDVARLFINVLIHSLSLCFEDINLQDNEELKFILKIVNLVFAVLFTVEMFLKWIAFGLNKYFASVWTCLDFVIVLVHKSRLD